MYKKLLYLRPTYFHVYTHDCAYCEWSMIIVRATVQLKNEMTGAHFLQTHFLVSPLDCDVFHCRYVFTAKLIHTVNYSCVGRYTVSVVRYSLSLSLSLVLLAVFHFYHVFSSPSNCRLYLNDWTRCTSCHYCAPNTRSAAFRSIKLHHSHLAQTSCIAADSYRHLRSHSCAKVQPFSGLKLAVFFVIFSSFPWKFIGLFLKCRSRICEGVL